MSARTPRHLLLVALVVLGCGARGRPPGPRALVIAPASTTSNGVHPGGETQAPADETAQLELAMSTQQVCVRVHGRVHCTTELDPDRPLTASPALEGVEDAVSLAVGASFGCAVTRGGSVFCFGGNENGELGARLRADKSDKPVAVTGITNAKRVFAGEAHACALLADRTVKCWGRNESGQTGGATRYLPHAHELVQADVVEGVHDATSLALGSLTTCASTSARDVFCWGHTTFPTEKIDASRRVKPSPMAKHSGFDEVAANGRAFCGIAHGDVKCWGDTYALLTERKRNEGDIVSIGVTRARRLRVARAHACALLTDGAVTCWGSNYQGALGRGDTTSGYDPLEPEIVMGLPSAIDIAVGGEMSCAVTAGRDVYCWGAFPHGEETSKVCGLVKIRIAD